MNILSITDLSLANLASVVKSMGLKPYAVNQIISWLYKKNVDSFDQMTNLSQLARSELKKIYKIRMTKIRTIIEGKDKTKKIVIELEDKNKIESVLIYAKDRTTLCVSTQVGCAMGCAFCRTGQMGFIRDLSQGEILGQIFEAQKILSKYQQNNNFRSNNKDNRITNIVFMGMGEPLANLSSTMNAIEVILDERAFNLSKRRITVSTAGLVPQMEEITNKLDIKLAVSLNATDDKTRNMLMPINRKYSIVDVMNFCRIFSEKTKHRITFEYVMIKDVNDSVEDMKRLIKLLKGVRAKVNLIPFNPFEGSGFKSTSATEVEKWFKFLLEHGIQTNVRISKGQDIMAACGQLAV